MNEITKQPNYSRKATETEIIQCLALLAELPSRRTDNPTISHAAYCIALRGVGSWSLQRAAENILQGKHGHTFFPTPVELRQQCDEAMAPVLEYQERAHRRRQIEAEQREYAGTVHKSPEAKARVQAMVDAFKASMPTDDEEKLLKERAEVRNRYGMTPEVLAKIPDAKPSMQQVGKALGKR